MCKQDIDSFHQVRALGDAQLIEQLKDVLSRQRCSTAELVCHLSEVEVRGIHLRLGYSSMHEYCVSALHMSDDETYVRVRAARLSRDYPAVLVMLAKGEIHLSALKLLAPHLSEENCAELLGAARFATKREVDRLVSIYAPKPDVKNEVRKLPSAPRVQETLQEQQPLREPASSSSTDGGHRQAVRTGSRSLDRAQVKAAWHRS